jgi:hypothetical protein
MLTPSRARAAGDRADIAGNGEPFWFGELAHDVARELARDGRAIIGAEVYLRRRDGFWATYLEAWSTATEREPSEPWAAWVARALAHTLEGIDELAARLPWPLEDLRIFFATVSEP